MYSTWNQSRVRGADQTVDVQCPTCDEYIVVRTAWGRLDHIEQPCSNRCNLNYCHAEWAYLTRVVEQEAAVEDDGDSDRCGHGERER